MSSNLKIIFLPLIAVLCLLAIWFYVKPIYDDTKKLNEVDRPQIESLVLRENEMQQRTEKLSAEINENAQADPVLNALPEDENSNQLLAQFEFLVNQEKMVLAAVNLDPPAAKEEQLDSGIFTQSGKTYLKVNGNLEVRGSYSQFKQLISDLYKLNRIVNINQIEVTNTTSDEGSTTGKFIITFTGYWQPPITTENVRNGLESLEHAQRADNKVPGLPTNNLP